MKNDRFYNMIGLAAKAGKAAFGAEKVHGLIKRGKARLLVLAADASASTIKRYTDKCTTYKVLIIKHGRKERLGKIVNRGEAAAIVIIDDNFAKELQRMSRENTGVSE